MLFRSNIYIFFYNSLGSVKLSEALSDERKPNQVSWANKVPSSDYLAMVMISTSTFGFSFLEEKYSKDVSTYAGLYSTTLSSRSGRIRPTLIKREVGSSSPTPSCRGSIRTPTALSSCSGALMLRRRAVPLIGYVVWGFCLFNSLNQAREF